jgi:hypothetical protein
LVAVWPLHSFKLTPCLSGAVFPTADSYIIACHQHIYSALIKSLPIHSFDTTAQSCLSATPKTYHKLLQPIRLCFVVFSLRALLPAIFLNSLSVSTSTLLRLRHSLHHLPRLSGFSVIKGWVENTTPIVGKSKECIIPAVSPGTNFEIQQPRMYFIRVSTANCDSEVFTLN